jgi:large subunit ribosomal protein L13
VDKTFIPKAADVRREWYVLDAEGVILGRLASRAAQILLGKHKTVFTPGVELGDFVIVVNASKVRVTGRKMTDKVYYRHSGYPGGLKSISLRDQLARHPDRVVRAAVWGMIPHGKRGRRIIQMLKVYGGPSHPHEAQKPKRLA